MAESVEHQHQKFEQQHDSGYGVLLYYKYTSPIEDLQSLYNFYEINCSSLGLLGRVRLATNGVNVTVGGNLRALEKHIEAVKAKSLFEGTDFKLASCHEPLNDKVADECGFTSLSIRIVKELVTLSSNPLLKPPAISSAGKHLTAAEFHSLLKDAALWEKEPSDDGTKFVLLDARNLYETRIGKFESPNVETLDPAIRQYSDLPTWIDNNLDQLRGNNVLMYCTGGIRCEMASAYIRSKGDGFENVFQLYGGIQRYLEQFPDGGFFKGKNFVFDHRISVGSSDGNIMGSCLLCGVSFDDYSSRNRCSLCRILVLVCDNCQKDNVHYACELCQRRGTEVGESRGDEYFKGNSTYDVDCKLADEKADAHPKQVTVASPLSGSLGISTSRKLRILCLHGFRQNASGFKGRTASLAKKLKSMVEFVFVDAPHELRFIYQPSGERNDQKSLLDPHNPPPAKGCNKKHAWLVSPAFHNKEVEDWEMIDRPFDPLQYQDQTEGFDESFSYIQTVWSQQGPFDGILGFSQGAAMAALVCAQREWLEKAREFRFAILCSGFPINLAQLQKDSINCPSLHVYGKHIGKDRQITSDCSRDLASLFEERSRVIIEHDSGHIIPTQALYLDKIRSFLQPFV